LAEEVGDELHPEPVGVDGWDDLHQRWPGQPVDPYGCPAFGVAIDLIPCAMAISWRSSADFFAQILGRRGVAPDAVTDVEEAWGAFEEFLQVEIDGIEADTNADADGFIVQWGCYSWNNRRPSLSFTRQLAVADQGDRDDECWQPDLWQVDLELVFDDAPDLDGIDELPIHDTGFSFDPIGPQRSRELAEFRAEMERYPQLRAIWRATPAASTMSMDRSD
jgi:hypothetical protein